MCRSAVFVFFYLSENKAYDGFEQKILPGIKKDQKSIKKGRHEFSKTS